MTPWPLPPFLYTVSNRKLDGGKAGEQSCFFFTCMEELPVIRNQNDVKVIRFRGSGPQGECSASSLCVQAVILYVF